jgi:hypothetical protein
LFQAFEKPNIFFASRDFFGAYCTDPAAVAAGVELTTEGFLVAAA